MTGEWFRRLVEHAPDAILVVANERLRYLNAIAVQWMGAQFSDELIGRHITGVLAPDAIPQMRSANAVLREIGEASDPYETQLLRSDGAILTVEAVSVLTLWGGEPAHQIVLRDGGALVATRRFDAILASLDEGVIVVRLDGRIKLINAAAIRIYGLGADATVGDFAREAAAVAVYDARGNPVAPQLRPGVRFEGKVVECSGQVYGVDMPTGERKWLRTGVRLLDSGDPDSDVLVSFSDITAEREDFDRLVYQANHDPLTGLPNRAFVLRKISEALASPDCGQLRAVLFIDVDDLKTTNDTLGHDAGDELLNAAATRLRQAVGLTDVVGRHGGDEFVLLIYGDATRAELDHLVSRLRARLAAPVAIVDTSVSIRASVGIVEVERDDGRSAEAILRDADRAMYEAKRAGRGQGR
ncbi:sensor domain-containing diguanylate cyclase [Mycolicibacterium stellerae]|uniref:sensor domain-containing diguanylate cyclase n=1 Tax=Mycolicibacterium stellerae TaxID=2358193 RepID=UPI0013DE14A0|nr:sensor domain-containing diguanylate cyclase [Mycolicibacterium stellerae]